VVKVAASDPSLDRGGAMSSLAAFQVVTLSHALVAAAATVACVCLLVSAGNYHNDPCVVTEDARAEFAQTWDTAGNEAQRGRLSTLAVVAAVASARELNAAAAEDAAGL